MAKKPAFQLGDTVEVVEVHPDGPFGGTSIKVGTRARIVECEKGKVIVAQMKNGEPLYFEQKDTCVKLVKRGA